LSHTFYTFSKAKIADYTYFFLNFVGQLIRSAGLPKSSINVRSVAVSIIFVCPWQNFENQPV